MIDSFIEAYYIFHKKQKTRGYQIIDKKLTIFFFFTLIIFFLFILFYFATKVIALLVFSSLLLLILLGINKKIDRILKDGFKENQKKDKIYIKLYLESNKFNRSDQYKLFAGLLKERGNQSIKKYELTPSIAIIVSIVLVIFNNILQSNASYGIYFILIVLGLIFISINPIMNVIANLFYNFKPLKILYLAELIDELSIEMSIQENN